MDDYCTDDNNICTLLENALLERNHFLVLDILSRGIDLPRLLPITGSSTIVLAVELGMLEIVNLFIANGNINAISDIEKEDILLNDTVDGECCVKRTTPLACTAELPKIERKSISRQQQAEKSVALETTVQG